MKPRTVWCVVNPQGTIRAITLEDHESVAWDELHKTLKGFYCGIGDELLSFTLRMKGMGMEAKKYILTEVE